MSQTERVPEWDRFVVRLGLALHRQRVSIGLTQEELAHRAGITRSHYQQLEKGQSRPGVSANPSLLTLVSLSEALGIAVEELLARSREGRSTHPGAR